MKNIGQNLVFLSKKKKKKKKKRKEKKYKYQNFTGFWLTKVGNDFFNIGFKFPDDTL